MERVTRCQGVVLQDNHILVARQYNDKRQEEYWLLPGGSLEEGESEEVCILRELKEEANLEAEIVSVLFDEPGNGGDTYKRYVTFLCRPLGPESPGAETASHRKILELIWCSLDEEDRWNEYLLKEQFYPSMRRIRDKIRQLRGEKHENAQRKGNV